MVGRSPAAVCNPAEFAEFANIHGVDDDKILVSFDVVSLFTNVLSELASSVVRKRLQADNSLNERIPLDTGTITELCLKAMYLSFSGVFYQQCFGMAMGSPV